jgi:hypothetical protein
MVATSAAAIPAATASPLATSALGVIDLARLAWLPVLEWPARLAVWAVGILLWVTVVLLLVLAILVLRRLIMWGAIFRPGKGPGTIGWSKEKGLYVELESYNETQESLSTAVKALQTQCDSLQKQISVLAED